MSTTRSSFRGQKSILLQWHDFDILVFFFLDGNYVFHILSITLFQLKTSDFCYFLVQVPRLVRMHSNEMEVGSCFIFHL